MKKIKQKNSSMKRQAYSLLTQICNIKNELNIKNILPPVHMAINEPFSARQLNLQKKANTQTTISLNLSSSDDDWLQEVSHNIDGDSKGQQTFTFTFESDQ
ncbi:hypothetical protein SS50377_25084 [Spironucleus salmonicida]|uniref:Uncharacterized protein n=1 Tax=Spironucleus salmonicida TaxID=348837 RepID=V6LQB8_9EUKA|nr:hypothetical protein SS50377_25084 [Spironucleus salmonicida]|eukprot:EST42954.1 Hypothetical protein SS50377_17403 [Spironucleus salmonicida]